MREHIKRNLLFGLAAAAVIAAVIIAVAPGSGTRHRPGGKPADGASARGDQRLAAEYLGLSPSELHERLRSGESLAEIAAATHGKSAAGLISDLLALRKAALTANGDSSAHEREAISRAEAQVTGEVNRSRGRTGSLRVASAYLGVSAASLRASLRSGKSLAELAEAKKGSSRAGLIAALIALKVKRLKTALRDRVISAAEEKAAAKTLHARVLRLVEQHQTPPPG